ncbi:MAG: hypothetical protein HGA96_00290 [Desulfobulbaceae bacterium]|nr:hypothetical protein [Desulfobulbaceae bacterium]
MKNTKLIWNIKLLVLSIAGGVVGMMSVPSAGWALAKDVSGSSAQAKNGWGRIARISPGEIVIGDTLYKYEAGTLFYSEDNRLIGSGYFAEGVDVVFVLKPQGERIIQKIWRGKPVK